MAERRVLLDAAVFLDSPHANFESISTADVRTIVQRFLAACYEDLGKTPKLLQGDELAALLVDVLPRRFGVRDPLADRAPDVLGRYLEFLIENEVVIEAYELRSALDEHADTFRARVASGAAHPDGSIPARRGETVQHRADKVGRNDPCPCGSGRKFKKCCMTIGGQG